METVSFGLFLFVCFLLLVAVLAIVWDLIPEKKRLKKQISELEQIVLDQQKQIEILSKQIQLQLNTLGQQSSPTQEKYEEYKRNGGRLDQLSWLLAQDEYLRFP